MKWSITYSKVTPESAEHGDVSEHGWYMPGGWHYALSDSDGQHSQILADANNGDYDMEGTLSELIDAAQDLGICSNDGATWFYSVDAEQDYTTGEDTFYCLHLHPDSERHFDRVARFINH